MLEALEIADYWDQRCEERFPVTYSHLLTTGYFSTPSARMTPEGEIGLGVAHAPPYLLWNGRIQPFNFLEFTANYRIFRGVKDGGLDQGFGDYADRGANFKYAFLTPERSLYKWPGVAFGVDDFMGSRKFTTYYLVASQVFLNRGIEASLGWGAGRYTGGPTRGFFGGFNWFPFWQGNNRWLEGLSITAEVDPTNYRDPEREPHPDGRESHTPINAGLKYQFKEMLELSGSYIRGSEFAAAASFQYNWGSVEGLLPKIKDPQPYAAPIDRQPLGCYRPESLMIQSLNYALEEQGFQLTEAYRCGGALWLSIINQNYRVECVARMRIELLLAALLPENIDEVTVVIESFALPCQEYVYQREWLVRRAENTISDYEFALITPRREACPPRSDSEQIFKQRYDLWRARLFPRYENFFGSAKGKYKYDLGLRASMEGFLPFDWFYQIETSYTLLSTISDLGFMDKYNPSRLPIVGTDYILYRKKRSLHWDQLYMQKSWNMHRGFFSRLALGYFQVNYGGIAAECLWYPVNSTFAIGCQGAIVKKRRFTGLGFQSELQQFNGVELEPVPYTTLQQGFVDLYIDFPQFQIFTKISGGQFLAKDLGVRLEGTRYFNNGLRLTGWITATNANDIMHGERYFNRGIALEVPFDFFSRCSSRKVWNQAVAAWLRDAGYTTSTGIPLFETLNRERR